MTEEGILISLEGPDGAGKTTQIKLLAEAAGKAGLKTVSVREPGGTPLGDAVRSVLLDSRFAEMTPLTEVFLYAAARAQLFEQVIEPCLRQGMLVVCDRFIDSTLAYQVYGGSIDFNFVLEINLAAVKGRLPDHTFVLDLPPAEGLARRPGSGDRVEQKPLSFHNRVRAGFLALREHFPERITVLDATLPVEAVQSEILRIAGTLFERLT